MQPAESSSASMTASFTLCDERLKAHASGALYWPGGDTLIVSDLHLEKGSAFAARGTYLPPYDSGVTLARVAAALTEFAPARVIALGDSFHDRGAPARLSAEDRAAIRTLTDACEWIWIAGNHDPEPPRDLGGSVAQDMTLGPFTIRHEPLESPCEGEIAGHLHPCATVHVRGRGLRRRCFVGDGARLVMPAFGAFTGGLDVLDEAFAVLWRDGAFHTWLMGRDRVYPVAASKLSPTQIARR